MTRLVRVFVNVICQMRANRTVAGNIGYIHVMFSDNAPANVLLVPEKWELIILHVLTNILFLGVS